MTDKPNKPCAFDGCDVPKMAGMGRRYCVTHADPKARLPSSQPTKPKAEKPSAVAETIARIRAKSAATTGTGKGDLYQQLSERREQMVADIEAIDRVLAII